MFDLDQLKGLVSRYTGASAGQQSPESVHADFEEAAQNAPPEAMAEGVSHAFRSDDTAPFHQMVSQLHANGNPQQQTGIVQQLMSSLGGGGLPASLAAIPGFSALKGMTGSNASNITASQASQLSPQAVEQLAQHANSQNPGVVDQISGFVSQHPGLVKTLGAGALTVVMSKMFSHHA